MTDTTIELDRTPPATWWLTHNFTDKAKLHADQVCEGLSWAQQRAADTHVEVTDLLAAVPADDVDERTTQRLLCRICALEAATVRVLSTPDPAGLRVTVAVGASAPGRAPSLTSFERIRRIGGALGMPVALGGSHAVLYGEAPADAFDFLHRNFLVALPPPGMVLSDDVVIAAWSLGRNLSHAQWHAAAASCL